MPAFDLHWKGKRFFAFFNCSESNSLVTVQANLLLHLTKSKRTLARTTTSIAIQKLLYAWCTYLKALVLEIKSNLGTLSLVLRFVATNISTIQGKIRASVLILVEDFAMRDIQFDHQANVFFNKEWKPSWTPWMKATYNSTEWTMFCSVLSWCTVVSCLWGVQVEQDCRRIVFYWADTWIEKCIVEFALFPSIL